MCGKVKYTYTGEPVGKVGYYQALTIFAAFHQMHMLLLTMQQAICHCLQCRKLSGSAFTTNLLIPWSNFHVEGSPKSTSWTQEMGSPFESFFCGDCGSLIYKKTTAPTMKDAAIVAAGLLDGDGVFEDLSMDTELYTEHRANWLKPMDGWTQVEKLPS